MIICEMCGKKEANMNITYGLYQAYKNGRPHHNFNLCSECSNKLWEGDNGVDGLKKVVASGLCHYSAQPPIEREQQNES